MTSKHTASCFLPILLATTYTWSQTQPIQSNPPPQSSQQESRVLERLPEHLLYIYTKQATPLDPTSAEHQLYANKRRWEKGRTLRVCLFGGNQTVVTLIREIAGEWNKYSSVKLDFGPQQSWYNCLSPTAGFFQVRVGFGERGYWSAVGNDSETKLAPLQPSMNLEDFNIIYSEFRFTSNSVTAQADSYHRAVIRHEFGHALGLLHEHQNPSLNCHDQIRWDGPGNVFEYLAKPPNGWTRLQVERNLGYIATADPDYVSGEPDLKSVMMYSLPPEIFKEGKKSTCVVSENHDISQKDKEIVAKLYPIGTSPSPDAPGELDIKSATFHPLPRFVDSQNRQDLLARVKADLESKDKYVRRDARARLADLLQKGTTKDEVASLVEKMDGASYRYQLGVANALANTSGKIPANQETTQKLITKAKRTSDLTLKKNLEAAAKLSSHK